MTRTYATALAFKAAVEQRLRNEIAWTGMELQRRRQLLVFDRYLARVFAVFQETAILKGGLVLELRLERARTTKDIDLRLVGAPDEIHRKLQEAGRMVLPDYMSFTVEADPRHPVIQAEGLPYEGRCLGSPPRGLGAPSCDRLRVRASRNPPCTCGGA